MEIVLDIPRTDLHRLPHKFGSAGAAPLIGHERDGAQESVERASKQLSTAKDTARATLLLVAYLSTQVVSPRRKVDYRD